MARPAKPKGSRGSKLQNSLNEEDLRPFLDEVHSLTDSMEEYSAGRRQQIGKVYEKASEKLGMTKPAVMFIFKAERRDRKDAAKAAKMDASDRDSLEKASSAFGGPFGDWLKDMAGRAGQQSEAAE